MENMYFLVEWELNDGYAHSCGVIHSSRLVRPPKEIHTGKLITVTHNDHIRRAKIIKISDDRESLEQDVFNLGVAMQQPLSIDNGTSTPSLDTTIKKLRNMLEQQNNKENLGRYSRAGARSPELYIEQNMEISPRNSITQEPNELAQLHEDLAKAQMQFMEITHFVDSLKDKVDMIGMRIKSWENDSLISSTSDNTFETPKEFHKRYIEEDEEFTPKPKKTKIRKRNISNESEDEIKNNINDDDDELVGIGSGSTKIPQHVLNQIDWRSHSIATRKLLMAIFPRKILATHSLTGKSSPAFTNKPAKLRLDPTIIKDIISIVSDKCKVNPSMVRGAITTKCADENKMFRTREEKKKANKSRKNNQENIEPIESTIKPMKTDEDL